jgi:hypothetical protein
MSKKRQCPELTVREAGRLGGLRTLARHGIAHYQKVGRKGQAKLAAKCTSAQRRSWGALGGRPKRVTFTDLGENGQ